MINIYKNQQSARGFTIVELLIVVVVIAILAAITIVSYNGITSRAKISAAQTAAESAYKKVHTYAITNSDQLPTDLATAGITDSGSTTYQYSSNTSTTPQTFCVTATVSSVSYYIDNTTHTNPTAGGCPGHGQNGVAAITNLATNPSLETNTTNWLQTLGSGGTGSVTRMTDGGQSGSGYFRTTWTGAPSVNWGGATYSLIPVTVGSSYSASLWVRSNKAYQIFLISRANNYPTTPDQNGPTVTLVPNTWTRLTTTFTNVPAGNSTMVFIVSRTGSGTWVPTDTLDVDSLIAINGTPAPNYADPLINSSWAWTGTPNASTSTGPAQ